MKKIAVNISTRNSLLIQVLLVLSLIAMDIFGEIHLDYIMPLYLLFWTMTYLDVIKDKKKS
jgi:hypothetical protein